ncbi:unnamed protein product [Clavelina lepadiformis]|uniref:ACB domain-containing protein n=1 Tax=Clavelina lepadiformis TaxID=159417 RepID=A0ABP0F015_CLALP
MADIETKFQAAVSVIQSLPKSGSYKPSPEMMLLFYSYYKQATEGKCNRTKPWSFDVINKAKWDAWNKLGNMSKQNAMENYVIELTKIIEALPATDKAADFVQTLGNFYEIIDAKSVHLKQLKKMSNGISSEGNSGFPNGSHLSCPQPAGYAMNGVATPIANGFHEEPTLTNDSAKPGNDNNCSENSKVVSKSQLEASDDLEADRFASESDDEFCDTSADVNTIIGQTNELNGSLTSSVSTSSLTESPKSTATNLNVVQTKLFPSQQTPLARGGEKGTHGIDDVQANNIHLNIQVPPDSQPRANPVDTLMTGDPLMYSSGAAGDGNPPNEADKYFAIQERIAIVLLQLQRDMHSVLNRLTTLETITIARNQESQHCTHCCTHKRDSKTRSWWIFEDLSPRTTLFIFIWPFLARWLISFWRKSRSRR